MKKNFIQDVIPPNHKRSIRDIPLPKHKTSRTSPEHSVLIEEPQEPVIKKVSDALYIKHQETEPSSKNEYKDEEVFNPSSFHQHHSDHSNNTESTSYDESPQFAARTIEKHKRPKNKKTAKTKIMFIGVVIILFIVFLSIFGRSQAIITIEAKQDTYEINSTIPLTDNSNISTLTQITKNVSQNIPATSEQQIEQVAQGQIRILNRHKEEAQDLVANTRFETPNGLIYRIREPITIPGYTMSDGNIVPGSLEVTVYADQPGEAYNLTGATNFTIPGFATMEQFDKINAELVNEITGGFVGIRKVVSEETKEEIEEELREKLKTQFENLQSESSDYIILPQLNTIRFSQIKDEASGNTVTLSLSATINAYSLPKKELSNFIGQNNVPEANSNDMFTIPALENLSYLISDENITISGKTLINWLVDVEKLKSDISGKKRSEMEKIVNEYSSFEKSSANIKPFWKRSFPKDISKIKVIITE